MMGSRLLWQPTWGLWAWIMVRKKKLWFITSIAGVACKFAVEVGRAGGGLDVRGRSRGCPLSPLPIANRLLCFHRPSGEAREARTARRAR